MAVRMIMLFFSVAAAAHRSGAQAAIARQETIQGRATTDGSVPVPGADVVVTMAPDRRTFETHTDSAGFYRIFVDNGTGDYLVMSPRSASPLSASALCGRAPTPSTSST